MNAAAVAPPVATSKIVTGTASILAMPPSARPAGTSAPSPHASRARNKSPAALPAASRRPCPARQGSGTAPPPRRCRLNRLPNCWELMSRTRVMRTVSRPWQPVSSEPIWHCGTAAPILHNRFERPLGGKPPSGAEGRYYEPDKLAAHAGCHAQRVASSAGHDRYRTRLAGPLPGLRPDPFVQRLPARQNGLRQCGAPLGLARADDAPPYFTILITGHIVVPLMLLVDRMSEPPIWEMIGDLRAADLVTGARLATPDQGRHGRADAQPEHAEKRLATRP